MTDSKIIYTHTDEAPALATYSLLPIVEAFAGAAGVALEKRDISLAGRILSQFSDHLEPGQQQADDLAELGNLATTPEANIIKLPNVSASMPQMEAAIAELQSKGYALPDYPDDPSTDAERDIQARYDKVKGSAVNPVLREGNSDRRAPRAVKEYAKNNPHSMGEWAADSTTHVATMGHDDFKSNEQSITMDAADDLRIEHVDDQGNVTVLKASVPVQAGEIVDGTFMSVAALDQFLREQIADAKEQGILFSLHLKATMMKVSDPIIFGHAVEAFFAPVFERFGDVLEAAGADPSNGWADVLTAIETLPAAQQTEIQDAITATAADRPDVAMVDSDRGITNLHVPSDIIVDASMPAMIRTSGQMWNAAGEQQDCKAVIPDSSYAGVYQAVIDDCQAHGAYDPATMGTVPNVGLMAQKAEEYGSHDKTFELPSGGTVRVANQAGDTVMSFQVGAGDVWRMCNVRDLPIQDWVKLAVNRARATGSPAVFWLDEDRAHDAQLIVKVNRYLQDHDTDGLDIRIMSPIQATKLSVERIRRGEETISVTGNVLRDYNTDLFPILEVGTSAKMLSIVPLMNGGGLFETGAGGSAPKHVQQLVKENYLRWDSLGEFLALAVSLEHFSDVTGNSQARVLGATLDTATGRVLDENKSPARRLGKIDNRGSHAWLAVYWAQALAEQTDDPELATVFAPVAAQLAEHADTIDAEMLAVQGSPVELDGYYLPDPELAAAAMRPSQTLNDILAAISRSRPLPASRVLFPGTLAFTMMASAFQVFGLAILASPIIDELDLSRAQLGLIGSVNTAVGALTAPSTGRLTDRIGPRRSVMALLILSALGMVMMAAGSNVWWLAVAAAVGGIPQGWGNPATNSLIATRVAPGRRGSVTGIKQSGVTLGVFLSGATLPLLERLWGWRGAFLAYAIVFAVLAIAIQLTLGPDPVSTVHQSRPTSSTAVKARLDPFVWRLALYALLMGTAGGAVGRFFPLYAEESLKFSLATAGLLTAAAGLLGMGARVYVGRLAETRIAPTRLLSLLAMVGVVYCLLLAFVDESTRNLLYLSPPLSAVGIAAWNAVAMLAVIMFFSKGQAGRASGVVMFGFLGGLSISAPIAGWVVDRSGEYWPVWLAAAGLAAVAAVTMWFDTTGRVPDHASSDSH